MATREQLIEGIRRADKAGDAEAVRTLGAALKGMGAAPEPATYTPSELMLSKATMGYSDKGRAALTAALTDKNYTQAMDEVSQARAAYTQAHPGFDWATLPVNFLGAVRAVPALLEAGVSRLAPTALRKAAVYGAGGGALAAGGTSRGDFPQQAGQIALSAGAGALLGPAVTAAAPFVGRGAQSVVNRARGVPATPPPSGSAPIIADALRKQGMTWRQAGQMVDEAQADGVPLSLMDTGDETRALAASLGRRSGPSRKIINDAVVPRQAAQGERVQAAIQRDLGPVANPREVSERLQAKAKADAAPLYRAAYEAPMPIMDEMASILKRIPQSAVENAKRVARLEGRDPNGLGVDFNEAGDIVFTSKPTMETLDYIKRGLDDVVEKYRDKTTGRLQLDGEGRAVNNLLRDFIKEIDRVNPAYAEARAAYAGPVRAAAALNKGSSFVNKSADDIAAETRDLTPFEMEQYRLGVRSALTRMIDGKGDYADKIQALIGTPKKRAALEKVFGGSANLNRLLKTLEAEKQAGLTYKRAYTGSPTAPNLADDANLSGVIDNAGAALSAFQGNPVPAIRRVMENFADKAAGKSGEIRRAEVAAGLTERDAAKVKALIAAAQREQARARALGMLSNRVSPYIGAGVGLSAGGTVPPLLARRP